MKFCTYCGTKCDGEECPNCHRQQKNIQMLTKEDMASIVESKTNESGKECDSDFKPRTTKGFIGSVCKFESKRGLIMCLITLTLAIVFMILAVTTGIDIMNYKLSLMSADQLQGGLNEAVIEYDDYYHIHLSAFEFVAAITDGFESNSSENEEKDKKTEYEKKIIKAEMAAEEEYIKWLEGSNFELNTIDKDKKHAELMIKHYENAGIFPINDTLLYGYDTDLGSVNGEHLAFMLASAIAILMLTIAIIVISFIFSLVALISMGMKKQSRCVLQMLMAIFMCSMSGLVLSVASPMLAMSGGMLAIALVSGLSWLFLSNAFALLYSNERILVIIKFDILAALMFIAAFLFLAPTVAVTITYPHQTIAYSGEFSISHIADLFCNIERDSPKGVSKLINMTCAVAALAAAYCMRPILNRMINVKKSTGGWLKVFNSTLSCMIVVLVMCGLSIFIKYLVIDKEYNLSKLGISLSLGIGFYFAIAFTVIALFFDVIFSPTRKGAKREFKQVD